MNLCPLAIPGVILLAFVAASSPAAATDAARQMEVSCSVILPPAPVAGLPGSLRMVEKLTVPPGADAHRHKHDDVELMEVLSGSGNLTIDGKPDVELKPGSIVELPPGTVHQQHNGSDTEPLVYTATFIGKAGSHLLTSYVGEKDRPSGCPHRLKK